MNIQQYVSQKKELYNYLMTFIDNENENEEDDDFQNLISFIEKIELNNDINEFKAFIHLLSKITKNHQSNQLFFERIEKIFDHLKDHIKKFYSDSQIFHLFKNNKRMLLLLFQKQILTPDDTIINFIKITTDKNGTKYRHYFYPEIKPLISDDLIRMIEGELFEIDNNYSKNFEFNRQSCENDSYICQLIRNDSVEDFVSYVNRANLSLSESRVKHSLFETNRYLIINNPTYIEYAAFFGAIQIFRFLRINGCQMNSSLPFYAIRGKNADIIHILEEDESLEISYMDCFNESIKCHHNNIAHYFRDNFIDDDKYEKVNKFEYTQNYLENIFHYYNYEFFPDDFSNPFIFDYLCKYNYIEMVKIMLNAKSVSNINQKNISNHFEI